ncbi:MAG TPA: ImmA/IrrE family metallo-endopeptidase [Ktedonobacteraceae bacterium]|nr:ImmA/IrrE family metallo-endopeptidase [Ktedonobacteraceae bacterium]
MLCCRCQKFIVAYDGKPCEKTINAQQKGVLQWLCYDCRDACQPVTCLCGVKTIANTDGEIFVKEPELLNGQIYLCDICKKYEIKDTCHICKKMVVALGTNSDIINMNKSRLYGYSDTVACRSCWSGSKKCGVCETPVTNAKGKDDIKETFLEGATGHPTAGQYFDYRCSFCNKGGPVKNASAGQSLYLKICKWFYNSSFGLGFGLDSFPQLKVWDSHELSVMTGNQHEKSKHVYGGYSTEKKTVNIEHYLPQVMFIVTAAHELAHAWQDQKGIFNKQTDRRSEGFAEWVAYVYLEENLSSFADPEREAAKYCLEAWMKESKDPIYGEGLRDFLKIGKFSARQKILEVARVIDKP